MLAPSLGGWFYVGWVVVAAGVLAVVLSRPRGESTRPATVDGVVRLRGDRRGLVYVTGLLVCSSGLIVVLLATGSARDVFLWICLVLVVLVATVFTAIIVSSKKQFVELDCEGITISQGARYRVRWDDLEGVTIYRESIVGLQVAEGANYIVQEPSRARWFRNRFGGPQVAVMTDHLEGGIRTFREEFTRALNAYQASLDR